MSREQRLRGLGVGIFLAVAFVVASVYFHAAGTSLLPSGSHYTVSAIVPTAVALAPDADVREAGVNVGQVTKIASAGPDGTASLIQLQLNPHTPVFRNAQVLIRTKSVAGENYVELTPGSATAGPLPNGGMLGISSSQDATQIDQLLSIFNQARQSDLQRALSGLGSALSTGGRNLNETLEATSALPDDGSAAAVVLAADRNQLADLISTFGTVAGTLGARQSAIRTLTLQIRTAAQAVAARNARLRQVLSALPSFLTQAQTTAQRLQTFALRATPVLANLRTAADDLVPTVQVLLPAARRGEVVVTKLKTFAGKVLPALRQLRPFAQDATRFVPPLSSVVRVARPLVDYLGPYLQEISGFFSLDAGSLQATDSTGHVGRILLPVSTTDLAGVLTPAETAVLRQLEGSFNTVGQNAYPAPGQVASSAPFSGSYPRLTPDPPYSR